MNTLQCDGLDCINGLKSGGQTTDGYLAEQFIWGQGERTSGISSSVSIHAVKHLTHSFYLIPTIFV